MAHPIIPLLWKEFKANVSNPLALLVHLLNPTLYIIVFAASMAANFQYISYQGLLLNYMNFIVPGIIAQHTFSLFSVIFSLTRIDVTSNLVTVIMMSRAKMRDYFLAKLLFYLLLSSSLTLHLMILGWLFGGYFPQAPFNLLTIYILLFMSVVFWFSLGSICGILIRDPYMRDILFSLLTMPIILTSSIYYNLDVAPLWIKLIGSVNPLTLASNLLRLSYFGLDIQSRIPEILGLAMYTSIALTFAIINIRRLTIK